MKDYNDVSVKDKRDLIEGQMSSTLAKAFHNTKKDSGLSREVLAAVENVIEQLKEILASPDKQEILGGEFNKDKIYLGSEMRQAKTSMPLYFELDLLIAVLEKEYMDKFEDKEQVIQILKELGKLREETATLNFSSKFQPQEKLNDAALDEIIEALGDFEIEQREVAGVRFLEVNPTLMKDKITYRSGEYDSDGVIYGSLGNRPIYEKDVKVINAARLQKIEHLLNVVGKYFVKDWDFFTTENGFLDKLVSRDIDSRIMDLLRNIYLMQNRYQDLAIVAEKADPLLEEIITIEDDITKKRQASENHQRAIDQARARYQAQSPFWKFLHRKMNPDKMQIENMTTEEIDNLYQGRKR